MVERYLGGQTPMETGEIRTRSDEREPSDEDVPQLRQFIEPRVAQESADARYFVIGFFDPYSVLDPLHAPEFMRAKHLTVLSHAFLAKHDRSATFKADGNSQERRKNERGDSQ